MLIRSQFKLENDVASSKQKNCTKNVQILLKTVATLYKTYVQLQNKGLDILNHINSVLLWREVTVPSV